VTYLVLTSRPVVAKDNKFDQEQGMVALKRTFDTFDSHQTV